MGGDLWIHFSAAAVNCGGTGSGIAGTVAMTPMNQGTQAWLGKISRILGNCVMTVLENVDACVGGSVAATAAATAAANSPSSESSSEVSLFSFSSSNSILSSVPSIFKSIFKSISKSGKFIWYGQMSNTAGFQGKWSCSVAGPKQFRVIQEIKIVGASKFHQRQFRLIAAEVACYASIKLWQFEDTQAIADYSACGFTELNSALRTNELADESIQERIKALTKAMSKLPTFQGRVYRGTDLPYGMELNQG